MTVTITEAEMQNQLQAEAKKAGWLYYHTYDSRKSKEGFPDVVLVKPPRLLFVELKGPRGKATAEQKYWIDQLRRVSGVHASFVWPSGFSDLLEGLWKPDEWWPL